MRSGTSFGRLLANLAFLAATLYSLNAHAGYTHYWRWHGTPDAAALAPCVDDMRRIADARRDILADDHDREKATAVFVGTVAFPDGGALLPSIAFNGIGDDAHEPFALPLVHPETPDFQFTKTQWKPYDEVVVACLIAARDHFPPAVLTIESDGEWSPDWAAGARLYERVLGRTPHDPLEAHDGVVSEDVLADGDQSVTKTAGGSVRKNLLISLGVFVALGLGYALVRRRE